MMNTTNLAADPGFSMSTPRSPTVESVEQRDDGEDHSEILESDLFMSEASHLSPIDTKSDKIYEVEEAMSPTPQPKIFVRADTLGTFEPLFHSFAPLSRQSKSVRVTNHTQQLQTKILVDSTMSERPPEEADDQDQQSHPLKSSFAATVRPNPTDHDDQAVIGSIVDTLVPAQHQDLLRDEMDISIKALAMDTTNAHHEATQENDTASTQDNTNSLEHGKEASCDHEPSTILISHETEQASEDHSVARHHEPVVEDGEVVSQVTDGADIASKSSNPGHPENLDVGTINHEVQMPVYSDVVSSETSDKPNKSSTSFTHQISPPEPSDQDFLLLLMLRAKRREADASRALKTHDDLQKSHTKLRRDNEYLLTQLRSKIGDFDQSQQVNQCLNERLQIFSGKYRKLKDWAMDMNKEWATLKQQGQEIKHSLSDLKHDNNETRQVLTELESTSRSSRVLLENIKQTTTQAQISATNLSENVRIEEAKVQENQSKLTEERAKTRRLEQHITFLANQQGQANVQRDLRDRDLTVELGNISTRLGEVKDSTKLTDMLNECLQVVNTISTRQTNRLDSVDEVSNLLQSISDRLDKLSDITLTSIRETVHNNTTQIDQSVLNNIQESLQQLRPDLNQVKRLQEEHTRFDERVKGFDKIYQLLEHQRHVAENRVTEFQQQNERLIAGITCINTTSSDKSTIDYLESKCSDLAVRWTSTSSSLKDAEAKLAVSDKRCTELSSQLNAAQTSTDTALQDAQAKFEQAMTKARSDANAHQASMDIQHDQQIKTFAMSDIFARKSLNEAKKQWFTLRCKLVIASSKCRQLENRSAQIVDLQQELKEYHHQLEDTRRELEIHKSNSVQLSELQTDIEQKAHEISQQQEKLTHFHGIQEKLDTAEINYSRAIEEADQLKLKLHDLQTKVNEVTSLQQRVRDAQEDLEIAKTATREEADSASGLRHCIQEKDQELASLKLSLSNAQKDKEDMDRIRLEKESIDKEKCRLDVELSTAQEKLKQIPLLEKELQGFRDEAERVNRVREGIPQEYLDSLSQDLVLSMKSIAVPATQSKMPQNGNSLGIDHASTNNPNQVPELGITGRSEAIDPQLLVLQSSGRMPAQVKQKELAHSQMVCIPDSQGLNDALSDVDHIGQAVLNDLASSSSLSDLSGDDELYTEKQSNIQQTDHRAAFEVVDEDETDLYDIPNSSPALPHRSRKGRSGSTSHALSDASQDSMLLQATPGRQSVRDAHSRTAISKADSHNEILMARDGSTKIAKFSPRRLRSERTRSPTPSQDAVLNSSARHQPNSAAKRRNETAMGVENVFENKRLKRTPANLQIKQRPATAQPSSKTHTTGTRMSIGSGLPIGSKGGSIVNTNAPAPGNGSTQLKSGRKNSGLRHDRYAAKFAEKT